MNLPEESLDKVTNKTGMTREELVKKISRKLNEFSGIVTEEGAFYMVAKELGLEVENSSKLLKIKNITAASRNVNFAGRIFRISPIKEFVKSNGKRGKVLNVYLSDGTGYVRIPFWDDQANLVQEGQMTLGNIVEVSNAMPKENLFGEIEIVLGKYGNVKLANGNYSIPSYEELSDMYFPLSPRRTPIKEITPGNIEIAGSIAQVFKSKFLFESPDGENYLIVSCVIDDGTGDIRVVFFRELAEKFSGIGIEDLKTLDVEDRYKLILRSLLGREFIIQGRVVKNKNFNRLEMTASDIKSLNVLEESKRLIDMISALVDR